MDNIVEYSEEVIDRFIRSMGYDPRHIDRDKRMAFTKTIRFQQFASRMEEFEIEEQTNDSPVMANRPYTKGIAHTRAHSKDMSLKRSVHVNKPQEPVKTEEVELDESRISPSRKREMSKSARIIKSIYKKKRMIKDEVYDWEKDDKGADEKDATAVLKGGKTLTGQNRDTVIIDPVIKKPRPGSPNGDSGDSRIDK